MVNSLHRQEGPRQRDDRGPQRVRERARTTRRRAARARACRRPIDWHNYGKTTIGDRTDIENVPIDRLQAFYRTLLPARQRACCRRRPLRRAEGAGARREALRRDCQADAHAATRSTRRADAGRRALGHAAPRRRRAAWSRVGLPRARGRPRTTSPPSTSSRTCWATRPAGRLHKALVETGKAAQRRRLRRTSARPGPVRLRARWCPRTATAAKARRTVEARRKLAEQPVTQAEVDESRQRIANASISTSPTSIAVGMGCPSTWRAGRLAFAVHSRATRIDKVTAADVNRVAAAYLKSSNRTLGRFVPTEKPDRAEIPAGAECRQSGGRTTRAEAVVAAGENFDPSPRTSGAHADLHLGRRPESVACCPRRRAARRWWSTRSSASATWPRSPAARRGRHGRRHADARQQVDDAASRSTSASSR